MMKQITKLTRLTIDDYFAAINDVRKKEGLFNQRLEEIFDNGEISIDLYHAVKREIREEMNDVVSRIKIESAEDENSTLHHK